MSNSTDGSTITLRPRDPLIVRDARPFDPTPGARATTLPWPLPQTIAGALRTHIGNSLGLDWADGESPRQMQRVRHQGPFLIARKSPEADWNLYFSAPADAVMYRSEDDPSLRVMRLRPRMSSADSGVNMPHQDLWPVAVNHDVKPVRDDAFWSICDVADWLSSTGAFDASVDGLPAVPTESRMHVQIDPESGVNKEGQLFTTAGLVFADSVRKDGNENGNPEIAMLSRLESLPAEFKLSAGLVPLGGERRVTAIDEIQPSLWPEASSISEGEVTRIRLLFTTPALFDGGWRPGWLDRRTLEGSPPGLPELNLRLVSAATSRRIPVSGWRIRKDKSGPRATRYAVPAGGVYFFETCDGPITCQQWRQLHLTSIADRDQDRRDGYGLVLPGIWSKEESS